MGKGEWENGLRAKRMVSALWLSKRKWDCGTRRPAGRRVPPLMALVFAVAVVHRARCTDSRMEQKLQMEISVCSICSFPWWVGRVEWLVLLLWVGV